MTLLPIVERELRVRARQPATFWVRFGTALTGLSLCALQLEGAVDPSEIGATVFSSLVAIAFFGCALAFLLTTDLIASERRENTLGLLFLTRVKALDILAGKTVSGGLTAIVALLGFLPLLMLPVLLGGVAPGEAFRTGLVLLVFLAVTIVAGIWASSRSSDWLKSTGAAAGVVFLAYAPLAGIAMVPARDDGYAGAGILIYWLLLGLLVLFGLMQYSAAHYWIRRAVTEAERPLTATAAAGTATSGARRRARLADNRNPIEWCVRHERGVRTAFWVSSVLLFFGKSVDLLFQSGQSGSDFYLPSVVMWTLWLLTVATGFAAAALQAWAAARFIQAARRTGELEVILTTPLGAGDFITGHWRALRARLRAPVMFGLLPMILHAAITIGWGLLDRRSGMNWTALARDLWVITMTWIEVVAICWVGMWFGLRATRPGAAVALTVGLTNGLPFAVLMGGWVALSFMTQAAPGKGWTSGYQVLTYVLLPAFLIALVFWARRRLQADLAGVKHVRFGARSDWEEIRDAWRHRHGAAPTAS